MSDVVAERIRAAIEDHGPIGFDEYMELALYGPGGFFEHPPIGAQGHFVTSPHVHPWVFGHCVRDALLEAWAALGEPDPLSVVELGAGDGTLARALLDAFGELPAPRVELTAVDVSSGAREALAAKGLRAARALDELAGFEGVVFANELLDNLPFARVRGRPDGPAEVRIALGPNGTFVEEETAWSRPGTDPPRPAVGEETTFPVGVHGLLRTMADRLQRGYALLIDYGTAAGTVEPHGYRDHREVGDLLSDPGSADITAGVEWPRVVAEAERLGLRAFERVSQTAALRALGHPRWDQTMREVQRELQEAGRDTEAVRVWEARSRASLLGDPTGLGDTTWLVLATDGLPEPGWLARARSPAG